jgi:hypothetical protein
MSTSSVVSNHQTQPRSNRAFTSAHSWSRSRANPSTHFTPLQHVVVPWAATRALLPVLFVTVYPEAAWPYNVTPYLFLATLAVGFAYMRWGECRNRQRVISPSR